MQNLIGDPSWIGWAITAAYAVVAVLSFGAVSKAQTPSDAITWRLAAFFVAALCINKQLDFQTGLTELGRAIARDLGVLDARRTLQTVFVILLAVLMATASVLLFKVGRRCMPAARVALVGIGALLLFILLRASAFHHVGDALTRRLPLALASLWELAGLASIGLAAIFFRMQMRPLQSGGPLDPP